MVFFGTLLVMANRSGLLIALHRGNPYYKLLTLFSWISVFNVLFHTAWYYVENIRDFDLSTSVLGAVLNMCMHVLKINIVLVKNDQLLVMYYKLRRLCIDPKQDHFEPAKKVERNIELITRIYVIAVAFATLAITTNPLLVQLIEYLKSGSVVRSRYELPFPYASPFIDLKSSPWYEVSYLIFAIGIIPVAIFAASPDLLFMATCMHIKGLCDHVKDKIKIFVQNPSDSQVLRQFVDYQNEIYDIVKETQRVFGSIFFIQSVGSLVIVCTQIFVATQNLNNARALSHVTFSLIALTELLLYTYFGTRLSLGQEGLNQELSKADWNNWTPKQRQLLAFLIKRSQRDCHISFLNWLPCSESTLRGVLANSFNLFALLQTLDKKN